jgi:hypothetical protein
MGKSFYLRSEGKRDFRVVGLAKTNPKEQPCRLPLAIL